MWVKIGPPIAPLPVDKNKPFRVSINVLSNTSDSPGKETRTSMVGRGTRRGRAFHGAGMMARRWKGWRLKLKMPGEMAPRGPCLERVSG